MICIGKITDEDFEEEIKVMKEPRIRYGARGLVFNSEGKIAVLYKKIINEYKLIGGGIDENEDPIKAFKREDLPTFGFPSITVWIPSFITFPSEAESIIFCISPINSKSTSLSCSPYPSTLICSGSSSADSINAV